MSAFDCSQWRHKNVDEGGELGPKHIADESHDYWVCFAPILIFFTKFCRLIRKSTGFQNDRLDLTKYFKK